MQVVKKPYVLLYNNDNDMVSAVLCVGKILIDKLILITLKVERGFINLSRCKVELSKSESDANGVRIIIADGLLIVYCQSQHYTIVSVKYH